MQCYLIMFINKTLFTIFYMLLNVHVKCDNGTEYQRGNAQVNDVANDLINTLDVNNEKIKQLKQKIYQIDQYVINRDIFTDILLNQTSSFHLNQTNFFKSLNDSDNFEFLLNNESKNLYLKMKEKMNRDDILKILSEKGENNKLVKSARKMLLHKSDNKIPTDDAVDDVIDKFIAQKLEDNHKFEKSNGENSEWDPQGELDDLNEYHRHDGRRIYKGERTTVKYYPFMVSVHVMGRFWCGGSIYWSDIVLTSAACLQLMHNNRFFRENPGVLRVRVGSNHSRIGGEMVEALEVYFHPGYNSRTLRHNIAIIRLRRQIRFSEHRVPKRIEISNNHLGISPTSEILVLGWGVTKITQKMSYEPIFLSRKVLPVYPNIFCKEVYGSKFITNTMFCGGTFTTGEGACDHDAGGPAVIAGKLVGIISFGPAVCGFPNTPTVFTLVGAYYGWIESIRDNMPPYYRGKQRTTTLSPLKYNGVQPLTADLHYVTPDEEIIPIFDNSTSTMTTQEMLRKHPKNDIGKELDGWSIELTG